MRGDRPQELDDLLARVAVPRLSRHEIRLRRLDGGAGRAVHEPLCEPDPEGPLGGEAPLQDVVLLQPALGVDGDHLAGAELSAAYAAVAVDRHRPGLGRADDEAVVADGVAQRAQAVAVERRADDATVGEDDAGRPVPRLDEAGVVAEEVAHLLRQLRVPLPGGGHEHGERVADVAAAVDDEVERVVEHGRVGAGLVEHGVVELVVGRPEVALTGAHPVDVALDGVDLPVVAQEPERLCPLPGGRRVRREALVEDAERDLEIGPLQVEVERAELVRRAERLVGDGLEGERGDVGAARSLGAAAGAVGAPLRLVVGEAGGRRQQKLLDPRHRRPPELAEVVRIDRHHPPAERLEILGPAGLLDVRTRRIVAQEHHSQPASRFRTHRVRKRQQETGSVTRPAVARDGAPVAHPAQALEQRVEDGAGGPPAAVGNEADPAGVALGGRVVERWSPTHNLASPPGCGWLRPCLRFGFRRRQSWKRCSASSDPRATLRRRAGRAVVHAGHR